MIRSLAAIPFLALALVGCSPPEAQDKATAVAPLAAPLTGPVVYAVGRSLTREVVVKRGYLTCGVHPGLPGFALQDPRGEWRGFDVDICRVVATAVLGDARKVRFKTIVADDRFGALQDGQIDLLSRNTSETFARSSGLGLNFPVTTYFDGQGFLVNKSLGLNSAEDLSGAKICVQAGTASVDNLEDFFRLRGLTYRPVIVSSEAKARQTYESEGCDAFTADVSALAASRSLMRNPGAHVILPEVISKEPLGPVVRRGDPVWAEIVRWAVLATLISEELGLSSRTVDEARQTALDPETRRLLGVEGDLGRLLGLKADWAFQIIKQVGGYHEIFRHDLGEDSALRLERGLNALWSAPRPGLMYAPPMR